MNCLSALVLLAAAAFVLAEAAEAKRGCKTFGHSCFGGMGKRSPSKTLSNNEEAMDFSQTEEDPAFVFTGPRSVYKMERPLKLTPHNIPQVIRQLAQYYRKVQELRGTDNI